MKPRRQAPSHPGPDDDRAPGTALDDIRADLAEVEALAHAAKNMLQFLPYAQNPKTRRNLDRLYVLLETTSNVATKALDRAEQQPAADRMRDVPR